MAEDRYKEWYREKGPAYNAKRRERYRRDAAYRKEAKERSRAYKRANPGVARWLKLAPPKADDRRCMLPRSFMVKGAVVTCFTTRTVANAVGVRATTVSGWERRGVLPAPTYLDPSGHRWYSGEYVRRLKSVVDKARREQWSASRFTEEVKKGVGDGLDGNPVSKGRVVQA